MSSGLSAERRPNYRSGRVREVKGRDGARVHENDPSAFCPSDVRIGELDARGEEFDEVTPVASAGQIVGTQRDQPVANDPCLLRELLPGSGIGSLVVLDAITDKAPFVGFDAGMLIALLQEQPTTPVDQANHENDFTTPP